MNVILKKVLTILSVAVMLVVGLSSGHRPADAQTAPPQAQGLAVVESTQSFDATWTALVDALEANPAIRIIAQVDHAAAAAGADLTLENNRVVFFGNPNLGTPVMQASRTAAIDLPQKMQVFEADGRVFVAFNPASYLSSRHGASAAATLPTIDGALANLARVATNTEGSISSGGSVAAGAGLTTTQSPNDFETTWSQLLGAIEASPASVAFTVDHGQNSSGALAATRLVVFGNPALGTPLMADQATAGVDLPLKMLVYEDDAGVTHVVSTDPSYLQQRHGITALPQIGAATTAIANFTAAATANDEPAADPSPDTDTDTDADAPADADEVLGTTQLAVTGSDLAIASAGLLLLGSGAGLVVISRRRRMP